MAKEIDIEDLKQAVLDEAESRRLNAGYAGRMDDGGARLLKDQVKYYSLGQMGKIPEEWMKFATKLDPEYELYQRLKNKFEK